jgi:hypothetical protein
MRKNEFFKNIKYFQIQKFNSFKIKNRSDHAQISLEEKDWRRDFCRSSNGKKSQDWQICCHQMHEKSF